MFGENPRYHVLPEVESSVAEDETQMEEPKDIVQDSRKKYLDGIRGLACFIVYVWHFSWPYQPQIFYSYGLDEKSRGFFQLPFVSLLYAGDAMVRVFFVLSGFILSERLMTCHKNGDIAKLADVVSSMALRRGFRLFLPPLFSSILTLLCTLAGLLPSPVDDIVADGHVRTPIRKDTWSEQITDWSQWVCHWLLNPWPPSFSTAPSQYGPQFWTIPHEYRCSMTIFLMVVALAPVRQRLRILILFSLSIYCMLLRRRQEELMLFLFGMMLADLEHRGQTQRNFMNHERLRRIATISAIAMRWLMLTFGLYLLSWPPNLGYKSPAYRLLGHIDKHHNHWHNVGACLTLSAVLRIESLKRCLSTKWVFYLGRISFALYCVHYIVNLVFGRMLLDFTWSLVGKDTETRYQLGFFIGFALTTPLVILASHMFYIAVDITSIRFSKLIHHMLTCE